MTQPERGEGGDGPGPPGESAGPPPPAGGFPAVPRRIGRLPELVTNLWWTWQPTARDLLRRLDFPLWRRTRHNGVEMLRRLSSERLEEAARDPLLLRLYDASVAELDVVLADEWSWYRQRFGDLAPGGIAYFCAEFGVHTSVPIYSGGLGILAGDHLKEAGDLGVPLVGCGLLYQKGYFRQRIAPDGAQRAVEEPFDPVASPLESVPAPEGRAWHASVTLGNGPVRIRAWRLQLGRVDLYLLDTDLEENDPADRALSYQLYGGDDEMRLRQEIVLGIGGVRTLRALGVRPDVWHVNEGHAAFLLLERLRERVTGGEPFEEARRRVAATSVFTTHTPVPAGHDAFPSELLDRYFAGYWPSLGLDREGFYALVRHPEDDERGHVTPLALRLADHRTGVSRRHGELSRAMWRGMWPEVEDVDEVPIGHVTNGVHLPTWVAPEFKALFRRHFGPDWRDRQEDPAMWERARDLPYDAVWEAHLACKRRLLGVIRERSRERWTDEGSEPRQTVASGTLLDPEALTLGFARRFATYKRADLILRDPERLRGLLLDPWRPVQLVFAGKAHPADTLGQELLARVYRAAADPAFGGRIAFLEDYEMHVAHHVVAGVDVWLNNPIPPMEASGTSGQKAAVNGVPHLSTLDGWWAEGYAGLNGWAIDEYAQEEPPPEEERDARDAEALYRLLEEEVVPLFYDRDPDDTPRAWVRVMREAIRIGGSRFSARRMLIGYLEGCYAPAARAAAELEEGRAAGEPAGAAP